jgi:hypothetical protein
MTEGRSGPNLLDALGKMVAFTPASAKVWIVEHPDDHGKVRDMLGSVNRVLEAITTALVATADHVNGADQPEQVTEPAADPQPEQRISPRTGKPVRQYTKRSAG